MCSCGSRASPTPATWGQAPAIRRGSAQWRLQSTNGEMLSAIPATTSRQTAFALGIPERFCGGARLLSVLLALSACGGRASTPSPAPVIERHSPAPSPVSSPTLSDLLRDDLAADSAFPWSAARRLTWNDFRGRPPAEGEEVAKTAYTLFYGWKCRGEVFDFRAIAAFRPRQSWVKAVVLKDSVARRSTLRHEQTHFDLAELHARRVQRYFEMLAGACRKTDQELTALARRLIEEEKAEQRRYDVETDHGLRLDKQAAWTDEVARRLR